MAETATLSKLLHIRENEKKEAKQAYHQSMDFFEGIATRLYTLLKRKENAEDSYDDCLSATSSVEIIKEQVAFIELLNNQIMNLQQQVQIARADMESKQMKLSDAYVEVKKFEKIIDTRKKSEEEMEIKREKASMDEVSIQQYLRYKNR
ncbi:flagellar FliJ protein [Virgibacillus natechei]|uniref:Flagellar FliJ protein n=1 Tax=Virgibacillus natechei TaxID=1216297 RepID=A0ABS4IB50_9BACI|nr:flagellar export protein FliJ [Virgibacillus natechei]MBP1968100.1 flagellar FliJ protein [Virgibacillus natechei]UZD14620.1 flagellar export protein FliJ [Virgibacillus natechei]